MLFQATDYLNRNDLESAIRAEVGDDMQANRTSGHAVQGTRKDLEKLRLDDTKVIFGVRVTITDTPTKQLLKDKIKK